MYTPTTTRPATRRRSPRPAGHTFHYNEDNQRDWQVEPRGNATGADPDQFKTFFQYDLAGNLAVTKDPLGHVTEVGYDAINRVISRTDANKHVTTTTYYDDDNVKTVTAPDAKRGEHTLYRYDANGQLISVRDLPWACSYAHLRRGSPAQGHHRRPRPVPRTR